MPSDNNHSDSTTPDADSDNEALFHERHSHRALVAHELCDAGDEWSALVALACCNTTREYIDRGYRRACLKYGWSTDNPFRAAVYQGHTVGSAERTLRERRLATTDASATTFDACAVVATAAVAPPTLAPSSAHTSPAPL